MRGLVRIPLQGSRRWMIVAAPVALLAGCAAPYRVNYPNYMTPGYFPPSPYAPSPPYVTQPPFGRPLPAPYFQAPEPLPDPVPSPEAAIPEPMPDQLEPLPDVSPEASPLIPSERAAPARPPIKQAEPGADAPLQGFRPMRGQTRPGI